MTDQDSPRQFETEIEIRAPRDRVFAALTDAAELSRWFAPTNAIDAREGGDLLWEWEGHFSWPQRIEIVAPGERLKTRYDSSVEDGHGGKAPLFVDFLLEGEGGTTTLRLVHSGFGADASFDEEFDGISKGWPIELRSLKLYLEQHVDADRQLAWSQATTQAAPETVWATLMGEEGFSAAAQLEELSPGDGFRFTPAAGEAVHGEVLVYSEREFVGLAKSHGDGFFRVWVGAWGGVTHVWLWLAMYRMDPARVAAEQERLDRYLAAAVPDPLPATATTEMGAS